MFDLLQYAIYNRKRFVLGGDYDVNLQAYFTNFKRNQIKTGKAHRYASFLLVKKMIYFYNIESGGLCDAIRI